MKELRVGLCIGDSCYSRRFMNYLMTHGGRQMKIHEFSSCELLLGNTPDHSDVVIVADYPERMEELKRCMKKKGTKLICLTEEPCDSEEEVICLEKYQDVNRIIDEILQSVGNEIREVKENGSIRMQTEMRAVYSLSCCEYQLPFAIAMADILGEKKRVLLLDLQENSGFSLLYDSPGGKNLEDLLVMAAGGRYSFNRMKSCIAHCRQMDYIYPPEKAESLYETGTANYRQLLQVICRELGYDLVILNLGMRFPGFYELLENCAGIYLLRRKNSTAGWREEAFLKEIRRKEQCLIEGRIQQVELTIPASEDSSLEKLVEKWKWSEPGNMIRRSLQEESLVIKYIDKYINMC